MPKKDAKTKLTKDVKTVYLPHETVRRLKKAAAKDSVSQSVYIDQALKARFKKDGIT